MSNYRKCVCGKTLHRKIATCPFCGATETGQSVQTPPIQGSPPPTKQRQGSGDLPKLILGVVIFFFAVAFFVSPALDSHQSSPKRPDPIMAYIMSQSFTKDRLKAPSTAEFPSYSAITVQEVDPDTFIVLAYVDAQNGFGAMIRNHYTCILTSVGGEQWQLIEHSFASQ